MKRPNFYISRTKWNFDKRITSLESSEQARTDTHNLGLPLSTRKKVIWITIFLGFPKHFIGFLTIFSEHLSQTFSPVDQNFLIYNKINIFQKIIQKSHFWKLTFHPGPIFSIFDGT